MNTDFTDARVGDKVYLYSYGYGRITSIAPSEDFPISATGNQWFYRFSLDGKSDEHQDAPVLFWDKPKIVAPPQPVLKKTITIMGVELPAPETEAPQEGKMYYMPSVNAHDLIAMSIWGLGDEYATNAHLLRLANGSVFLTAAAAAAHAKFWIEQTKKAMEKLNG